MKHIREHILKLCLAGMIFFFLSCTGHEDPAKSDNPHGKPGYVFKKPPSSYADTLNVNESAAVFYHPDSAQLRQIKKFSDSMVYDGMMHEFFYQMRNARLVIKNTWPELKIIEAKNCRYLLFTKKNHTHELVDLNSKNDAYGLFVFNTIKPPLLIDMTNIETEVSFYLK